MQRLNRNRYKCGYSDEISLYIDQAVTGFEMLAPVSLAMVMLLNKDDMSFISEMAMFFVASMSMYSAYSRSRTYYAVKKIDEIECVLEGEARRYPFSTSKVCLFSSLEEIERGHRKTRVSAGLAVSVLTALLVLDSSQLSPSQQALISVMVYSAMIAAYELFVDARASHFGAQVVEVEHAVYQSLHR